jgi:sortase A
MSTTTEPKRRTRRRLVRRLATLFMVVGLLCIVDAVITLVWEEPISSLYASHRQGKLSGSLDRLERQPIPAAEQAAVAKLPDAHRKIAYAARAFDRRTKNGEAIARLQIPRMKLTKVVVAGTDTKDLQEGPGHYPGTPLPGQRGTVGIAGHRTTYGAPFRRIDRLRKGDSITVTLPYGRFEYRVERTRIVKPTALWVTQKVRYDRLILSACHPLYSAAQRIVVFAKLQRSTPRGTAG